MTARHSPRRRDVYKSVTATATGLVAFGALTGTGYAAGAIAHQSELDQQQSEDTPAPPDSAAPLPSPARTVLKRRPYRTVIRTEVVHRVATEAVQVGSGGSVSATAPPSSVSSPTWSASSSGSSSSGSSGGGGSPARPPAQAAAPAPKPAPAPAPAPSSGS